MNKLTTRWAVGTLVLLGAVTVLVLASTATADTPIIDKTIVFKNGGDSLADTNPCTGSPAIDHNLVGRGTIHLTVFPDGTMHVSMSFHTDFLIDTIDPTDVDYSGQRDRHDRLRRHERSGDEQRDLHTSVDGDGRHASRGTRDGTHHRHCRR